MKALLKYNPLVLLIFHAIGIVLFLVKEDAASLSYITLLLSGILLLMDEAQVIKKLPTLLAIYTFGFLIELVGTRTGWLFGNYAYGESLGIKVAGVPLIIGINWLIIVISSASLIRKLNINNVFVASLLSAILCTLLDVLIEPVAIEYDMWNWQNGIIPIYNYICWLIFSFVFSMGYLRISKKVNNTGFYLFFIWVIFFLLLTVI